MYEVKTVAAKILRNKQELKQLGSDRPGYYKWLAGKQELNELLDKLGEKFESIQEDLEVINDLYCIYVGVAIKESIKARANWHINQKHTASNIKHGTLSTLRQSISSLLFDDQTSEDRTNDFIDRLVLEIHFSDKKIASNDAIKEISKAENDFLTKSGKLYVLNIKDNKHPYSLIRKTLKSRRADAKRKVLENPEMYFNK